MFKRAPDPNFANQINIKLPTNGSWTQQWFLSKNLHKKSVQFWNLSFQIL